MLPACAHRIKHRSRCAASSPPSAPARAQLEHATSTTSFRVALLVGAYVLIGHWAACFFFFISKWQARQRIVVWHNAPDATLC